MIHSQRASNESMSRGLTLHSKTIIGGTSLNMIDQLRETVRRGRRYSRQVVYAITFYAFEHLNKIESRGDH